MKSVALWARVIFSARAFLAASALSAFSAFPAFSALAAFAVLCEPEQVRSRPSGSLTPAVKNLSTRVRRRRSRRVRRPDRRTGEQERPHADPNLLLLRHVSSSALGATQHPASSLNNDLS